jgi:hypothetical protein
VGRINDRVSLHVEARATARGQAVVAAAFARHVPRYTEGGEIFFDAEDVRLENFRIGTGSLAVHRTNRWVKGNQPYGRRRTSLYVTLCRDAEPRRHH